MGILTWLICGFIAGTVAKMITPQDEGGGWISSIIIGIIGGMVGGWLGSMIGIHADGIISGLITAIPGAVLVLFLYHKFIAK